MKSTLFAALLFARLWSPAQELTIILKNGTEEESRIREQLLCVLDQYNVSRWIFTDSVLIEKGVIPHSYPIITLNTAKLTDPDLLAVFIHENIHRHLTFKKASAAAAIRELWVKYPDVPKSGRNEFYSEHMTYLHLLVNFLEYDALVQVTDEQTATDVLHRKTYYKWSYDQVREDYEYFNRLVWNHGLKL